ncbi:hypothetical protein CNR22_03555 [Sphingobacteriaceae bacterium]|nr:hypothetical protein CNR22_03555 [Sphingobacteriaceae bacterium]
MSSILFFFKAYRQLEEYIDLSARANKVHNSFNNLSRHVNNAAVIFPEVLAVANQFQPHFFYTDSQTVIVELEKLQGLVADSMNRRIAKSVDVLIRSELAWLTRSNVIDSIVNRRAQAHLHALRSINTLLEQGVQRTNFLVEHRKENLNKALKEDGIALLIFILLFGVVLISTTTGLFDQRSKRKNKEQELSEKEDRFSKTLDGLLEGVQIHDFNWRYIYANDTLERYSMGSKEELIGLTLMEKYPGIEHLEVFKILEECMVKRISRQFETTFIFPDGRRADFELSAHPVPEGLFILSMDITARKKTELKLKEVNRLYAFISAINQNIVHVNTREKLLYNACNIAVTIGEFKTAWIGWLNAENKIDMIEVCGDHPTTDGGKHLNLDYTTDLLKDTPTGRALRTGEHAVCNDVENDPCMLPWKDEFVTTGLRSNSTFPIKKFGKVVGVFAFTSGTKDFFDTQEVALLQEAVGDVSFALEIMDKTKKHEETEKLIVQNEKRFRALIEKSTDVKVLTSLNATIIYCSPSITKVLGYSEEEFVHKSAALFFHPDDLAAFADKRSQLLNQPGESLSFLHRFLHKNGTWRWCEGMVTNMFHEPAINAFVTNFSDITEKKLIEEEREKMSRDITDRNKHLEQFAYIISHNLRSPVANILGLSNLIKNSTSPEEKEVMQNYLFTAVQKLDTVVMDLNKILELRSVLGMEKEQISLENLVSDIEASIQTYIMDESVTILTDFSEIEHITSVRSYIHSIFYNLISNSIKYKKTGLNVTITIKSSLEKEKIKLSFNDNGIGMDLNRYGDKVFKLYQRFERHIEGKGMGLFMVKSQVETLGGTIRVASKPGYGTEFIIELPLQDD